MEDDPTFDAGYGSHLNMEGATLKAGSVAATSTGGTPNKLPGRVGDSPLIGCGAYADNQTGGVSATGWGESLMKVVMSKTTCDFMAHGLGAQQAAESAVQLLADRVKGLGGVIVVDALGRIGMAPYPTDSIRSERDLMPDTSDLLQQGIAYAKEGRREEARNILLQVVELDEQNESAWLWLSGVVDSDDDKAVALENVLALNPNNEWAKRGLKILSRPVPGE